MTACRSELEPTRFALRPTGVPPAPDAAQLSDTQGAVALHNNPPQIVLLVPPENLLDFHAPDYPVEVAWASEPDKKYLVRLRLDDGPSEFYRRSLLGFVARILGKQDPATTRSWRTLPTRTPTSS
jgi:hypothetical protein